jgi:HEAT repeat protein
VFSLGTSPRLAHGALSVDFDRRFFERSQLTSEALTDLLALARALEPIPSPEARLAEIARTDALGAVRARALRTLTESVGSHPATRGALQAATRDAEPAIRLQAAKALGAEGEPVLQALAADPQADDAVSAEALELLGARFTIERARLALARAVDAGHVRTAVASMRRVATGGGSELAGVAHALERSSGAIAVAATEALATIGVPAAEAPLLEALKSSEDVVAAAAAHALARCGAVGAVPELKDAEQRGGDVRRAARTAIAAIQARLTGASPGQVSLTGGDAGQLSVVETADGRVSLPPDEPPR